MSPYVSTKLNCDVCREYRDHLQVEEIQYNNIDGDDQLFYICADCIKKLAELYNLFDELRTKLEQTQYELEESRIECNCLRENQRREPN